MIARYPAPSSYNSIPISSGNTSQTHEHKPTLE